MIKNQPIWQNLPHSFSYPFSFTPIILLASFCFFQLKLPLIQNHYLSNVFQGILLLLFGTYCYTTLEYTSQGHFKAPSINKAFKTIHPPDIIKLAIFFGALIGVGYLLKIQPSMIGFISYLITLFFVLPAILILFVCGKNDFYALHPVRIMQFIFKVLPDYSVTLGVLVLMTLGFESFKAMFPTNLSVDIVQYITLFLNGYLILVGCHLLGHIAFNYINPVSDQNNLSQPLSGLESIPGIQVAHDFIKKGELESAYKTLNVIIKTNPFSIPLYQYYFKFLLIYQNFGELEEFSRKFIFILIQQQKTALAGKIFEETFNKIKKFYINDPRAAFTLAELFFHQKKPRLVLACIDIPEITASQNPLLPKIYLLIAKTLSEQLGEDKNAAQKLDHIIAQTKNPEFLAEIKEYKSHLDKIIQRF